MTSGPRLDPPMPSRATSVNSSVRSSSAKAFSSGSASTIFSVIVSQPNRSPISGTPGPPQRRLVLAPHPLRHALLTPSGARAASAGSSSSGIADSMVFGPSGDHALARQLDARRSACRTASRTRRCRRAAACRSPPSCRCRPPRGAWRSAPGSWSAVAPRTSAFSAAASSVGIGIVFTVSGATSSSTYLVSGYFGVLDTGRGPQRPLDGGAAPRAGRRSARRRRPP